MEKKRLRLGSPNPAFALKLPLPVSGRESLETMGSLYTTVLPPLLTGPIAVGVHNRRTRH